MAYRTATQGSLKILAYEDCGDCIIGILETDEAYQCFTLWPSGRLTLEENYPKDRYRDLEHFQCIMGKFEPYHFFLNEPVVIALPAWPAMKRLIASKF